jgi:hypothetical protein
MVFLSQQIASLRVVPHAWLALNSWDTEATKVFVRVSKTFFTTFLLAAGFEARLEFQEHQTEDWCLG